MMQFIRQFSDLEKKFCATLTSNLKCQYFVKSLCHCEASGDLFLLFVVDAAFFCF